MKKIITFIFFLMTIVSFSEDKNITLIKNLKLLVNEKTFVNNKATSKSYEVTYSLPDTLKKVMTEPKSHKGEIFIYKDNTKTVYLPIFDQVIKEDNIDVGDDKEEITIVVGEKENIQGRISRTANSSGTPRIIGNKPLKLWFAKNSEVNGEIKITFINRKRIKLEAVSK